MRILLANSFHYRRGGDSGQYLDLATSLSERGHAVATLAMRHPENLPTPWAEYMVPHVEYRREVTGVDRLRTGWRSVYSGESRRCMERLIADFAPDVCHFHSVHHHLTLAVVDACAAAGVPIVWTLHDYRTVCPATSLLRASQTCERCARSAFWHCAAGRCKSGDLSRSIVAAAESYATRLRGSLRAVDCYVAPSRFLAAKVLAMGLPATRMEVLPNPVQCRPANNEVTRRSGLLYVGRLSAEKGVDCLIEAVAGSGLRLRVVGDGPEGARLRQRAVELQADVEFEGWRAPEEVAASMSTAEALCVPSLWHENCPGVVLEAMSTGLPVIASDLGGLPELLDRGRAGWLVAAGDPAAWRKAIHGALLERECTEAKAARAAARARLRHDPLAFVLRLEAIYRSLAA